MSAALTEEQIRSMQEEVHRQGAILQEKWSAVDPSTMRGYQDEDGPIDFLEGVEDEFMRGTLAILMENQKRVYDRLDEMTRTVQIGSFEKFVFPILRAAYANIITSKLFSVQPLPTPNGLVFYFDILYGSTKGTFTRGSKMYDATRGPQDGAVTYTSESVDAEVVGTGAGVALALATNLSWLPIRPGTVQISDGTQQITDDGNGALTGDVAAPGTIDYNTGAIAVTTNGVVAAGTQVVATYQYNKEESSQMPEIELQLTSSPVFARRRDLKAVWSMDAEQDLSSLYGITAEVELVAFMANEIQKELYNDLVYLARSVAPGGYVTWDATVPTGVSATEHRTSFIHRVVEGSNNIFERTQRFGANWIVGGTKFCNVVETLPSTYFTRAPAPTGAGVHLIGTLSTGQAVYKDPSFPTAEGVMGYKGVSFLDAGIIQAIYLGLYSTDTIRLDDFRVRKALATRQDRKVCNARYYQKMRIINI